MFNFITSKIGKRLFIQWLNCVYIERWNWRQNIQNLYIVTYHNAATRTNKSTNPKHFIDNSLCQINLFLFSVWCVFMVHELSKCRAMLGIKTCKHKYDFYPKNCSEHFNIPGRQTKSITYLAIWRAIMGRYHWQGRQKQSLMWLE